MAHRLRTITTTVFLAATVVLVAAAPVVTYGQAAVMPRRISKYGITVTTSERTDFSRFKTYSWSVGLTIPFPELDQQMVASIDRQMERHGLTKVGTDGGDVIVTYSAIARTDVHVKGKPTDDLGARAEHPVMTVVVTLREPGGKSSVFLARADVPVEWVEAKVSATIDDVISRIFDKYPTRASKKHQG